MTLPYKKKIYFNGKQDHIALYDEGKFKQIS